MDATDFLLTAGVLVLVTIVYFLENRDRLDNVPGLPFYTDPKVIRIIIFLTVGFFAQFFLPKGNNWQLVHYVLWLYAYFLAPALGFFLHFKSDADWKLRDKAEREKNFLKQQDQVKDQQLASENAAFPPLPGAVAIPGDITETARRIAEEMKKG